MSGIASAASTIPGSVATFCSCSSERSRTIAARISSSAKTRAGTRMSGRASAGISYSVSSIRRGSDVEDHPRFPLLADLAEVEIVVGRRLDDRLHLRPPPGELHMHIVPRELDDRIVRNESVGVCQIDQLLEERDEPCRMIAARRVDGACRWLAGGIELDVAAEGVGGLTKDVL